MLIRGAQTLLRPAAFVALALGVLACTADAIERPSPIRAVRVNDMNAKGIEALQNFSKVMVSACQAAKKLPVDGGPTIPPSALKDVAWTQEEDLFDGDRIAHYKTVRWILADGGAGCKPYIWVQRSVEIFLGCEGRLGAGSDNNPNTKPDADPPPWAPWAKQMDGPKPAAICPKLRKPQSTDGVPTDDAGLGVNCIWKDRLVRANLGPLLKARMGEPAPGKGPADKGLDLCVYAKRPYYQTERSNGEMVVVRSHMPDDPAPGHADAQYASTGGMIFFASNTHLNAFSDGTPIGADRFTLSAAEVFVRQSPKEELGVKK